MSKAQVIENPESELSRAPQVGDKVRLRDSKRDEYRRLCKAAGFDKFDPDEVHVVTRDEPEKYGGRLFVEHQPFAFFRGDVVLAWDSQCIERRKALAAAARR